MKAAVRLLFVLSALGIALVGPARADTIDVDVTCPNRVSQNTGLRVDITLKAKKDKYVEALGLALVGNRDSTLANLGIFGPKRFRVEDEVSPGSPLVFTGIKVKRVPPKLAGDMATVVVTPLNDDGDFLGYGVCEVLVE